MRNRKKAIIAILKVMDTDVLVDVWNKYCTEENMDDYIWSNDEFTLQKMFSGNSAVSDALRAAFYGDYRYNDEYVVFNAHGNLKSYDDYNVDEHIDFDTLAEYIMNNDCNEIQDVWLEDIYADFVDFFNETFNTNIDIDEDTDFFDKVNAYNLLTDDWDTIAQEINEEM